MLTAWIRLAHIATLTLVTVLSGCATPELPSKKDIEALRTIEVVVNSPPSNFAYFQGGGPIYAQPSPDVGIRAGVGINVTANPFVAGIEYLSAATAREAEGPVGESVSKLDLRAEVLEQLRTVSTGSSTLKLIESKREFPKANPLAPQEMLKTVSRPAEDSTADAVLYVSVLPFFRSQTGRMIVFGGSWLIARSGTPLFSTFVTFVGPEHPDLARAELVRWWADQRYRRYLQHGVRATLLPTIDNFLRPPSEERKAALERHISTLPPLTLDADLMRSTLCAFESDDAPVVYRFERGSHSLRAAAHCVTERLQMLDPPVNPDQAWTTPKQAPLRASVRD